MGRGNACVFNNYEGLFFVDWDNFSNQYENANGELITDYDLQREEWENSLSEFKSDMKNKFKSFLDCKKWINNEEQAILENSLFYIVVQDNEWSMAIKLIQKEQDYYSKGNITNLQAGLYSRYLNGIKECLFNQFEELGTYSGAWTSGRIKRTG